MKDIGKEIKISGIVQGVGFRPFVWRIAIANNLTGFIKNTSHGVVIEVYGKLCNIEKFIYELKKYSPPSAEIVELKVKTLPFRKLDSFKILKSKSFNNVKTNIPTDLALCLECEKEIFDLNNRRYLYSFTNCTNCGPRFSIIHRIPYDRPYTTMANFKMCSLCKREYENPGDRRFHAQPNACASCGPEVRIKSKKNTIYGNAAIDLIVNKIIRGEIVVIKGLGGFHIACDAFNEKAVNKLRRLKDRPYKPFAVMSNNLYFLKKWLFISNKEEELLKSYKAPIVMLKKRDIKSFYGPSPNINTVGVMLPYTPLHKIIFYKLEKKNFFHPLIMTSGNLRDEPIIKDNKIAREKLKEFGSILFHNRAIYNRVDDSVCFIDNCQKIRIIRRARGYVPQSIKLPYRFKEHIFAAGADLKNSFALARSNEVFLSSYIGDLEQRQNLDFYQESIFNMKKLLGINPLIIISDLHPQYYSSRVAEKMSGRKFRVQHHLAHILSVMAENNLRDDVIGISFDGTGYGIDGNIWGGEFFVIKNKEIQRVAHFQYLPLPGGDVCTFEVWRTLFSALKMAGIDKNIIDRIFSGVIAKNKLNTINKMIQTKTNSPLTSSAGRIFDIFSALIKNDFYSTYEAQLPMELESMVNVIPKEYYNFEIFKQENKYIVSFKNALKECLYDIEKRKDKRIMAEKFHFGIVKMIVTLVRNLSKEYKLRRICLSGGVFQNKILLDWLSMELKKENLIFYFNEKVPSNDGGIALGQVYSYLLKLKNTPHYLFEK